MWRQMQPTIERLRIQKNGNFNALDVGKGSGILAIFTERVFSQLNGIPHPYTIKALDDSERSLLLTRRNCQTNFCHHIQILPKQQYWDKSVEPLEVL